MRLSCLILTRNHAVAVKQRMKEISPFVDEFVVAHDGCPDDDTPRSGSPLRGCVRPGAHMGYCEPAMVAGLQRATGDWVLVCADDEEYLSACLMQLRSFAHLSVDYQLGGVYLERAKSMTQELLTSTGYRV